MTVKITKPALNLREELADLRKPSGIAGEAMLRADSVQEQRDLIGAGRKNLIINGGFDVWQRGTSFTNSGSYSYTTDRWFVNPSAETMVTSRQAFSQADSKLVDASSQYYMRTEVTTTNANAAMCQRVENIYQFDGRTVTLSMWARGGQGSTGKVPSSLRVYANGIGSGTENYLMDSTYITLTPEWEKYEITFTIPTLNRSNYGSAAYTSLHFYFQQTASEACDWDMANVQLELGSVATEFEHRSYGEELALCQRYYFSLAGETPHNYPYVGQARAYSSTMAIGNVVFPVAMRSQPSLTSSDWQDVRVYNGASRTVSNITLNGASTQSCGVNLYTTGLTTGEVVGISMSSTTSYFNFDAEL